MTVPNSVIQLLVTLVLVVPGFVYQIARIRLRGRLPTDTELSTRIVHALVASTLLALAYVFAFGSLLTEAIQDRGGVTGHPRLAAALALLGVLLVPAVAAALPTLKHLDRRHPIKSMRPENWKRFDSRPTAWDAAFGEASPGFIRVRMRDGTWYAGYFGENSYASSFPDPQNLFLEYSYAVDEMGKIGEVVPSSAGAVLDCTDAVLVEFVRPADLAGPTASGAEPPHAAVAPRDGAETL